MKHDKNKAEFVKTGRTTFVPTEPDMHPRYAEQASSCRAPQVRDLKRRERKQAKQDLRRGDY